MSPLAILLQSLGAAGPDQQPQPQDPQGIPVSQVTPQPIVSLRDDPRAPVEEVGPDLVVTGNPDRPSALPSEAIQVGQQGVPIDVQQANVDPVQRAEIERRGRFGVHGILRDILGTVGDAFLLANGRDPIYYNRRRDEDQMDAWAHYPNDPEALVRQMGTFGNVGEARNLTNLQSNVDNRASQVASRDERATIAVMQRAGQIASSLTPDNWAANRDNIAALLNRVGVRAAVPETYDPAFVQRIIRLGTTPYQQQQVDGSNRFRTETLDIRRGIAAWNEEDDRLDNARDSQRVSISKQQADTAARNADTSRRNAESSDRYRQHRINRDNQQGAIDEVISRAINGGDAPDVSPRRAGDTLTDRETGTRWISRDGRTWVRR